MAFTCSICGKSQSSWITDYPLAQHLDKRICNKCHEEIEKASNKYNQEEAQKSISYIKDKIEENILEPCVKEYLETYIDCINKNITISEKNEQIEKEKENKLSQIIISSGFNFEGYTIVKYCNYISSETALGMGLFKSIFAGISNVTGTESISLKEKLKEAKNIVLIELKEQAYDLNANAIIGVDIDYTMFSDSIVAVIASGTAVIIESINNRH